MNTVYSTIELASYMSLPWKAMPKIWDYIRLIPDDLTHLCISIRTLKDYFSSEAKGKKLIAYRENNNYWIDLFKEDLILDEIKKKPLIRMIIDNDNIQVKI